ncbi:MAG: T9SS type A sorting domain-containing protein [Marinirhabdus sp.]|nr:T9SS type A sorting domain-containing protein [Marinirhabdus sp.]
MKKCIFTIALFASTATIFGQAVANPASDLALCDIDNDGTEVFDLTVTVPEILGTQDPNNFIVEYFETLSDAIAGDDEILSPQSFANVANPQTIYVRVENSTNGDFDTTQFELMAISVPAVVTPTPLEVCDDDGDGFAAFDLSSKDAEIVNGDPSLGVFYHETLLDAQSGVNALLSPYVNIIAFTQTVFVRVEGLNGCITIVELTLIVNGLPDVQQPNNIFINEGDGDGVAVFDLKVNDNVIQGGVPQGEVFYFTALLDAIALTNPIETPEAFVNTENPQTIYVALQSSETGCYDASQSFVIATDEVDTPDSDNDGLPDAIEDVNNNGDLTDDDTDSDGTPNFQDEDDDGDGTRTADEDYNNSGSPTDDDTNANRVPDYLDDSVVLGIADDTFSSLSVFPNPSATHLNVSFGSILEEGTIEILSTNGTLLQQHSLQNSVRVRFNTTQLASGIYFIRIATNSGSITKKFIKK